MKAMPKEVMGLIGRLGLGRGRFPKLLEVLEKQEYTTELLREVDALNSRLDREKDDIKDEERSRYRNAVLSGKL